MAKFRVRLFVIYAVGLGCSPFELFAEIALGSWNSRFLIKEGCMPRDGRRT